MNKYDDIGEPSKWAAFFKYPSVEAWANAGQYLYEIRKLRGSVRHGVVLKYCNEASGEIDG